MYSTLTFDKYLYFCYILALPCWTDVVWLAVIRVFCCLHSPAICSVAAIRNPGQVVYNGEWTPPQ